MNNIIDAIINLVNEPKFDLNKYMKKSKTRANSMGDSLESYVKDLFAGTLNEDNEEIRNEMISHAFSYLGNQNNPPDIILRGGDAIEVKKIETKTSDLALNSSYPKAKLLVDDPLISKDCRDCEIWTEKDMIYIVGFVQDNKLKSLAMVYGADYCAKKETYERIKQTIKTGVENIPNIEFTVTRELGRVNRVDPLGITYLRIRGMWGIGNPFTVFQYLLTDSVDDSFNLMCIINDEKFDSFDNIRELYHLQKNNKNLGIRDVKVKNPNNPAQLVSAKLITFSLGAKK